MRNLLFIASTFFLATMATAQLSDPCKLSIGTNLGGVSDYGTELPFVDLMKSCRTWYTKSQGDPNAPFDSGMASQLSYRSDGYPTHLPQSIAGSGYPQYVATIWAITSGWPEGEYVLLWDGTGELGLWGTYESWEQTATGRIVIEFPDTYEGVVELSILRSDPNDPIHNIRLLMPGSENTYETQPFYRLWLDKLEPFQTVRFMDWGQTNNWGQSDGWTIAGDTLVDWDARSQPEYYTYTHSKGIPYEYMARLMNDTGKDGWVCIPHTASEDYVRHMAAYFRDHLEPGRHIYVEYSNEIWNWIFGQTNWLYRYGCEATGTEWPEGIVPYIQRVMDAWTAEYTGQLHRTSRVVGVQTSWLDVSERIVTNLKSNSFDVISPTYYFGLSDDSDTELDDLGAAATAADIAQHARQNMPQAFAWIREIKDLADDLDKKIAFYEGGQHLTPIPFGEISTYDQALLDIQRDTAMYHLYNEWYDQLRTLQSGPNPLLLMNFSFVSGRSARYGSWGILETLDQDTSVIYAPKYRATLENTNADCSTQSTGVASEQAHPNFLIHPNPARNCIYIHSPSSQSIRQIQLLDLTGRTIRTFKPLSSSTSMEIKEIPPGIYILKIRADDEIHGIKLVIE